MTVLNVDFEVYSELDVTEVGAYKVAEHPSTEIIRASYTFDKEDVQGVNPGQEVPERVRKHIEAGGEVHAFNYQYERVMANGTPGQKFGWPKMTIRQGRCTAVRARAAGLPGNLGEACEAMGTHPKDEAGRLNMLQLTKPRKPTKHDPSTRFTRELHPEKFKHLDSYCDDDVRAERDLAAHLPQISNDELERWFEAEEMNDRGVYIDIPSIENFEALIAEYKAEMLELCIRVTGAKPTQREQVANWIRANGYPDLPNMQAETIKEIVRSAKCPESTKVILRLYSAYNNKAVMKFSSFKDATCADGRLRGMFIFCGASTTGRFSSSRLQNLFRPVIDDFDTAFNAVKLRDLDWIKMLWPVDPLKVFASCVRGVIVAPPEKKIYSMDYAGIESRFTAWLFGEKWKLDAFRAYDAGKGPDMYKLTWSDLFRVSIDKVTKKQRQMAKPIELAFGFEGGTGALVTFADAYGVDLDEFADGVWPVLTPESLDSANWMLNKFGRHGELSKRTYLACEAVKYLWREKHPAHKTGWKLLKDAAIAAVSNPGQTFGLPNKKVLFRVVDRWLVVLLPSGRKLRYLDPEVSGEGRDAVCTYIGVDTETRRFMRTHTYGGKWTENIAQGGSSDFLRYGSKQLSLEGYHQIMSVHDEVVTEEDLSFGSLEQALKIYTRKPHWAKDFPLAAQGYEAQRYRKD